MENNNFNLKESDIPVGVVYVDENGLVGLNLAILEEKMLMGELEEIQKGMDIIGQTLIDFFNRIGKEEK